MEEGSKAIHHNKNSNKDVPKEADDDSNNNNNSNNDSRIMMSTLEIVGSNKQAEKNTIPLKRSSPTLPVPFQQQQQQQHRSSSAVVIPPPSPYSPGGRLFTTVTNNSNNYSCNSSHLRPSVVASSGSGTPLLYHSPRMVHHQPPSIIAASPRPRSQSFHSHSHTMSMPPPPVSPMTTISLPDLAPPTPTKRAVDHALAQERSRIKELERMELKETITMDEMRMALKKERAHSLRLTRELAALRSSQVQSQAEAEICEEGRINSLMRRLDDLQHEKGRIIVELEREEEMLTNSLQKKLNEVRREKTLLEKQLEYEHLELKKNRYNFSSSSTQTTKSGAASMQE